METRFFRAISLFLCMALVSSFAAAPTHEPLNALSDNVTVDLSAPSSPPVISFHPASSALIPNEPAMQTRIDQSFGKLPLYFVENQGQLDERVAYYIQGSDKTIYFSPDGVTFALTAPLTPSASLRAGPTLSQREREFNSPHPDLGEGPARERRASQRWSVKLDFVGANPNVHPIGQGKTEAVISYFKGPQDQWHAGLPTYGSIIYPNLWPGIDLVYYGTVNQLKYEFIVQAGADPAQIRLAYRGADVSLNAKGQLLVTTPIGGFSDDTPMAYQDIDGQRVTVPMAYQTLEVLKTSDVSTPSTLYGFNIGSYDPARPLILDPAVLVYCGYIGGVGFDFGSSIAVDGAGNAYVRGYTESTEATFPVVGGPDLTFNGGADAFVAKVRADGTGLVYAGYIGGNGDDEGEGILRVRVTWPSGALHDECKYLTEG